MRVLRGFDTLPDMGYTVATIGSYDGVHRGHRILIDEVVRRARAQHGASVVITFEPHPRIALGKDEGLALLSTFDEKCALMEQADIDYLLATPFNKAFSRLSHEEFVRDYLIGRLHVRELVVGYNHHFGRNREGSFASLAEMRDIDVVMIEQQRAEGDKVSSTTIRQALASGDIATATRLLGHSYAVCGTLASSGELWVESHKLLPPAGLYMALIDGVPARVEVTPLRTIRAAMPLARNAKIEFI
ncbi:MAG: FAD synthetase [Alistipes sp.]|nr:FAD synthetase [Alistipes sp.]MBR2975977.1 FAD synthetase [Alistipes sp.]